MAKALPDTAVTTAGTPVTINVLANDTGSGLVLTSFSNPANGSLVFNAADKTFTYTPAAGFTGTDTFSYTVRDAQGVPATAEVTISVLADAGATVAMDDAVEVIAGDSVVIPVLANDMAAGGGALQVIAVSAPGHGVVNVLPDQSIRYVPQARFFGIDSFVYTVLDEAGTTASATVTVKVVAENSAPIAANESFDVVADTTTVLAILANDSDPNGGPLQIVGFTMPGHGSLVFNAADKTFSYTPDTGYEGQDQFTYTIRNNRGRSASATVTLTVARAMASPVAVDDQVTTEAGQPVTLDVLANDSLPEGQTVGIIAVTLPFKGKLAFNPDQTITYTPNAGFVGTDDFTYTIGNGKGGTAKAAVTIEVTPTSSADVYANGYAYRRRIAIPAQQVGTTSTVDDVVLLVNEQGDWLKSLPNGGKVVSAEGFDIRFELGAGGKLDHEIDVYDPVAGRLLAWVRLPNWALSSQFQLLLYYGSASTTESEANPAGVWQGYLVRWRFPDGSDATGGGRDLIAGGVAAGSLLGDAALFDGDGNLMIANTDWLADLSAITVQALVKPDASMVGTTNGILVQGSPDSNGASEGIMIRYLASTSTGAANVIHVRVGCQDGNAFTLSSANQQTDKRQLIHSTWLAGRAPDLYLDGVKERPSHSEPCFGGTSVTGPLYIGAGWRGLIDEVRIAGRALPADWIAVEARNMLSPELSYGLGHEETSETVDLPPIAVPVTATTTSGKLVDIDVLAQAFDPDGVGGLLLTGVSQPANGIATVVNNNVRYVPNAGFVGTDQFTYTISNGAKSTSGWIAVTVAAATASPSTPQADTGVVLPTAQRTVNVSNNSQMTSALSNAQPGDHIILANGSYSRITIARSGTQANPIVIRAANILGAVVGGVTLNASHVIIYGLDITANSTVGAHTNNKWWRNRLRNCGDQAMRLDNSCSNLDIAYSEWTNITRRGLLTAAATNVTLRYCMFRNSTGSDSGNDGEAIHWSFGPPTRVTNGLIYRCKFKNWSQGGEAELISIKCSGNIIRQVSVENCPNQTINNRFGRSNLYDAIWTTGSGGIGVHDGCGSSGNRVLGCRVDNPVGNDTLGIAVRAGQNPPCTTTSGGENDAAGECRVEGCIGTLRVGRTYSNSTVPARGTIVRQHTGSIVYDLHTASDVQAGVASSLNWSPLIWLEDSDVGPFANL